MKKTRLTANMAFEILGILGICVLITAMIYNFSHPFDFANVIFPLLLIYGFACYYIIFLLTLKTINFDDRNIYIKREDNIEIIPLQNINFIKQYIKGINYKNIWKVKYFDNNNQAKEIMFVPKPLSREISILQYLILAKNSKCITQNCPMTNDQ